MKYYRMSYEEVVKKRSYLNILLLNSSIPIYESAEEVKKAEETKPRHANTIFDSFF